MSLLPISKPVAEEAPASFTGSLVSPTLRTAYLDWRRVKAVSDRLWRLASDLPCGEEEDAVADFSCVIDRRERLHRNRVMKHPAATPSDRLLKLRCLLESDEDAFQGFDHGLLPDLVALTGLVTVREPVTVEPPETDSERRDSLTAAPSIIPDQSPTDLLRLFTHEEGSELFALAAAYRIAKITAPDRLDTVIASLNAYTGYAFTFDCDENGVCHSVPDTLLTKEERVDLARLEHLSPMAVKRLNDAFQTHRAEVAESVCRKEEEQKAQQAAAERAKHGPPTAERLIPLLPSFSEEARKAASSILINADMMTTIHGIIAQHAAALQTHELEELRKFDLAALEERFQAETQNIFRQEIDRVLRIRQATPANPQPVGAR
ncbi:hypothetical protein [Azospirillum agricola]|uniref:hypothetical protein n=1 Tax=Azospirillum agricola TaxID=1720247 RepID=UPI000A0F0689|nr:hypothetical protein [Azospirillum agricola]SMH29478.1 hypothetical protein SAMN02982994_0182 [Azospirillum lipoferum]